MEFSDILATTSPPGRRVVNTTQHQHHQHQSSFEESPAKRVKLSTGEEENEGGGLTNRQFSENLSSSVTLVLKNNEEVIVERSILSHYSNYFRTIFSSKFRDSDANVHRIRLIASQDLHLLLAIPRAFEQGLKPAINVKRAVELLEPAAYLQINTCLAYITDIICDGLTHENIIKIFRLSLLYHTPLAVRVWRAMIRQFQKMFITNVYLTLKENELIGLLTDKHLNLRSEDERTVIANWIKHNSPLESDQIVQFAARNFSRNPQPDASKYEVIRTRQPSSAVVAFGGWASRGIAQKVEVFNTRCDRWQTCNFDYDVPNIRRAYNGITVVDDKLIVFGGFNGTTQYQTTLLFDLTTRGWKSGSNMHDKRCYITSATYRDSYGKDMIFACGGMNGVTRLKTAEMYDHVQDRWMDIADMKYVRSDGATVALENGVLCVGGFDGRHVMCHGEVYDPYLNKWTPITPMRTRRTGCSAVSIMENVCMVVGGFNGTKRLDTSEMYDTREGIWHPVSVMHTGRSNFGVCFMDYSVYVAGGFDGQSTTKDNERLDLRNRKWQALPDLNEPKSALRLVKLADHAILDELFDIPDDSVVTEW